MANICVGADYLEVCRRAVPANDLTAMGTLAGIESVLSGSSLGFAWEYRYPLSGGEVWYTMTVKPLHRPEGGAVTSHLDITERKHAEMATQRRQQELARGARVAIMGELSASLAHELNHPLGAVLSNAQAAQRFMNAEPPDFAEVRAILANIVADNQRAVEVIHQLRRFLQQGERESLSFEPQPGQAGGGATPAQRYAHAARHHHVGTVSRSPAGVQGPRAVAAGVLQPHNERFRGHGCTAER